MLLSFSIDFFRNRLTGISLVLICLFSLFQSYIFSIDETQETTLNKRINAHLIIGDYNTACDEAFQGLQAFPNSKRLWQAYLLALAKTKDEKTLMVKWSCFVELFPEEKNNKEILEGLAWAVIDKGFSSSSPIIRIIAMLGAFFSQDAKGVVILQQGLNDSNSMIRGAAAKLSSHLFDASLQDEMLKGLKTEKVWKVRLEIIQAIGRLKLVDAEEDLKKIIQDNSAHQEERAAAISALVSLSEKIDREHLKDLILSKSSGMRLLACEFISSFDQKADADFLLPLVTDGNPLVRAKAFLTLSRLRVLTVQGNPISKLAEKGILDTDPKVAATAAFVLMLHNQELGVLAFQKLMRDPILENRCFVAAALASTGKYGLPLMAKIFNQEQDIFVKMNLAFGMIGQRYDLKNACDSLYKGLTEQKQKLSFIEENTFKTLVPSKAKHDEMIPNYPEALNQLTRLDILQILATVHYPKAQLAIKKFLQDNRWGISGMASALLLTEGDEEAIDLVQQLLEDEDLKLKVQAALILSLWGQGESVIQVLQSAYGGADRELKGQILEGIGRVGSEKSCFFLAECLKEPYQTLRIIAAAALLECLYH